jgi:hypothetical protein
MTEDPSQPDRGGSKPNRRLQFTLAWMLACFVFVGVILSFHRTYFGGFTWETIFPLSASLLLPPMILLGNKWLRLAAVGFLGGVVVEFIAVACYFHFDLIRFVPGTALPEGWWPFFLPLTRLLVGASWAERMSNVPGGCAVFLSGILGAALLTALWYAVGRLPGGRRGAVGRAGTTGNDSG